MKRVGVEITVARGTLDDVEPAHARQLEAQHVLRPVDAGFERFEQARCFRLLDAWHELIYERQRKIA